MSVKSKPQLTTENQQNFPTNNTGFITADLLREFNQDSIDSFVDELSYQVDSASVNASIVSLENFTGSLSGDYVTTGSFNTFTQSVVDYNAIISQEISDLQDFSSSLDATFVNETEFGAFTQSVQEDSASFDSRITNLGTTTQTIEATYTPTASFDAFVSTTNNEISNIEQATGSYAITGSNTFVGNQTFQGDLFVDGNLTARVLYVDSSSIVYTSGSTKFGDTQDDTHQFTGSVSITGSAVQLSNNGQSGTLVDNLGDAYTDVPFVQHIVTLTESEYNSLGTKDPNTLYVISGSSDFSTSGTSGTSGVSGTAGESGTSGTSGESGTSGTSGVDGARGATTWTPVLTNITQSLTNSTTFTKGSGGDSFNGEVYSLQGYSRGVYVSAQAGATNTDVFFGLSSNPTASAGFANIDYSIYFSSVAAEAVIYENGVSILSAGVYTTSTVFYITYDGENVRYFKDNTLIRTTSRAIDSPLYLDTTFFQQGSSITNLIFGPMGESGTSGVNGTSGINGTSGVDGQNGTSGIDGTNGTNGVDGTSGIDGTNGTNGVDGSSGIDGTNGTNGVDGSSGTNGIDGTNGTNGIDGSNGTSGTSGVDGAQGVATGRIYYLNLSQTGSVSPYNNLSEEPTVLLTASTASVSLTSNEQDVLVAQFITEELGFTIIPSGVQRFTLEFLKEAIGDELSTYATVQFTETDGTPTGSAAPTNAAPLGWIDASTPVNNFVDVVFPTTQVDPTWKVLVSVYLNNQDNQVRNATFYTENAEYSYVVTSVGFESGTSGTSGVDGTSGINGTSGIDGTNGTNGVDGTSGVDGSSGTSGVNGENGTSGVDGTNGTNGVDGSSGTSGIDGTATFPYTGSAIFSGSVNVIGDLTLQSGSYTGSVVDNINPNPYDVPEVKHIVSITSASYSALGTKDPNTLYVVSGSVITSGTSGTSGNNGTSGVDGSSGTSGLSGTATFPYTGSAVFSGSLVVTGSVAGNVVHFTPSSNSASIDLSLGSFFTSSINSSTHFTFTNIKAGTTAVMQLNLALAGGVMTFDSAVKQPSGSSYVATESGTDILTFTSLDGTNLYLVATNNLV